MTTTTIKVSSETRDRLKAQARAAGRTLGVHLAHLADQAERKSRMRAMRDAMARTSPEDMAEYMREMEAWDVTLADGLDDL